jgi:hypothetical protein
MRIHMPSLFAFLLAFLGCSTTPLPEVAEKQPEHAGRVQVAIYDSTSRPKTSHLDVYDTQLPQRPYKEIALLTCEGEPQEEAAMTTAILYRARMLGADAVMSAGTRAVVLAAESTPAAFSALKPLFTRINSRSVE